MCAGRERSKGESPITGNYRKYSEPQAGSSNTKGEEVV